MTIMAPSTGFLATSRTPTSSGPRAQVHEVRRCPACQWETASRPVRRSDSLHARSAPSEVLGLRKLAKRTGAREPRSHRARAPYFPPSFPGYLPGSFWKRLAGGSSLWDPRRDHITAAWLVRPCFSRKPVSE